MARRPTSHLLLAQLQADLHRLLRQAIESQREEERWPGGELPLDVLEYPDHYEILVDVPGIDRAAIHLGFEGPDLWLEVDRSGLPVAGDCHQFHRLERSRAHVRRRLPLPADIDPAGVRARLQGGVLNLRLPRSGARVAPPIEIHDSEEP